MGEAPHIWFLVVYFFAVLALVAGMIGGSFVLGQRHMARSTIQPFESGVLPVADARLLFPIQFYLVAMCFLVFDVEIVFLFPWAVLFQKMAWGGFGAMLGFLGILAFGWLYLYKRGALEWE